jgi:penicillin-binding protein 2
MGAMDVVVRQRRGRNALALSALVLLLFGAGFFHLQVMEAPSGVGASAGQRVYAVPIVAPRGVIVDRYGAVLGEDVVTYSLVLLPVPIEVGRRSLQALAPELGLDAAELAGLESRVRRAPRRRQVIAAGVPYQVAMRVEAEAERFPGVYVHVGSHRLHPGGPPTAAVLAAVESRHGPWLRGRDGIRYVRVDGRGGVAPVEGRRALPALAGGALRLSLDLGIHQMLDGILGDTIEGAVVALDPGSGEVLAFYASNGLPLRPYPLGRLGQLVTAAAGLRLGTLTDAPMTVPCRGGLTYGDRYLRCHDPAGHGGLAVADALARNCDIYFLQAGMKIGLERLAREGTRLGLGRATGLDLPGEDARPFPPASWPRGRDVDSPELQLRLASGDLSVEASPLQLAHLVAALVSTGPVPAPALRLDPEPDPAGPALTGALDAAGRAALMDGLRMGAGSGVAGLKLGPGWVWGALSVRVAAEGRVLEWAVLVVARAGGATTLVVSALAEAGDGLVTAAELAARTAELHLRTERSSLIDAEDLAL